MKIKNIIAYLGIFSITLSVIIRYHNQKLNGFDFYFVFFNDKCVNRRYPIGNWIGRSWLRTWRNTELVGKSFLHKIIPANRIIQSIKSGIRSINNFMVPFLLAALIETAQGSRVVTAVITAEVLGGSVVVGAIHPLPLILLISAGSCVVSYVTDPFFWLVQRTTGDDVGTVVRNYTLPIAFVGLFLFIVALCLEYLVFRAGV